MDQEANVAQGTGPARNKTSDQKSLEKEDELVLRVKAFFVAEISIEADSSPEDDEIIIVDFS